MGIGHLMAKQATACLQGRDGKLLGNTPEDINNYLNLANAVLAITEILGGLDTAFLNFAGEQAVNIIDSYEKGRINDIIHDEPTYQWFKNLSSSE
jgi:hypothetical protein